MAWQCRSLQAVNDLNQLDRAFATMVAARAEALLVVVDPLTVRYRGRIVELAMTNQIPAMYGFREFVDAGGLIAYGDRMFLIYVDALMRP